MSIPSNNDNLNYLIDPAFTNANRLFVLLFERIEKKQQHKKRIQRFFFTLLLCTKRTNKRLQCLI